MTQILAQAGPGAVPAVGDAAKKAAEGAAGAIERAASAAADGAAQATDAAQAVSTGDTAGQVAEVVQNVEPTWLAEFLDSGAIGLLVEGGFFMWPILILGIVAVAVMIERYRSLKLLNVDTEVLRREVLDLLNRDRVEEALRLCDSKRGPVPAILSAGLRKLFVLRRLSDDSTRPRGRDLVRIEDGVVKSMEDYGVHVVAALERHLPILGTVSSVAPMLGFLGTVQGMIVSFKNIVETMGETNIVEAAASGIQVALLTTCFGLIVGIPAYIAFNYFTSVINRFVLDVEESSAELIEAVTLQMAIESRSHEESATSEAAAGVAD